MGKKVYIIATLFASFTLLTACGNQNGTDSSSPSKSSSKKKSAAEDLKILKLYVDGMFTDSKHDQLSESETYSHIKSLDKQVAALPKSAVKSKLSKDILQAEKLWPEFKKQKDAMNSSLSSQAESDSKSASIASESSMKVAAESNSIATSESIKAKESAKTDEEKIADRIEKNVMFGYLDKSAATEVSGSYYQLNDYDYAHVGIGEHNIIKSVKLDFRDVPLLDRSETIDYVQSFTADDATKVSVRDSNSDYYHSNKTGLDYLVKYESNSDGITYVLIYPKQ